MQNALCELFPADLLKRHKKSGRLDRQLLQELRSPLCAISLSVENVRKKTGGEHSATLASHLALLERNVERMAGLLELFEEREPEPSALEFP